MASVNKMKRTEGNTARPPTVSRMEPDMATPNRGSILPEAWSVNAERGLDGRAAYHEPEEFTPGPQCGVGVGAREMMSSSWRPGKFNDDPYDEDGLATPYA